MHKLKEDRGPVFLVSLLYQGQRMFASGDNWKSRQSGLSVNTWSLEALSVHEWNEMIIIR